MLPCFFSFSTPYTNALTLSIVSPLCHNVQTPKTPRATFALLASWCDPYPSSCNARKIFSVLCGGLSNLTLTALYTAFAIAGIVGTKTCLPMPRAPRAIVLGHLDHNGNDLVWHVHHFIGVNVIVTQLQHNANIPRWVLDYH
jgi:hypothetical protein